MPRKRSTTPVKTGEVHFLNLSISQGGANVAKQRLQPILKSTNDERTVATPMKMAANVKNDTAAIIPVAAPKVRQIHKEGEVNISAYFPAEVKASLRMVQAKTGNNVKDCLGEALRDLFRKHNVPVYVELGKGR
jgi:hypothetical protein